MTFPFDGQKRRHVYECTAWIPTVKHIAHQLTAVNVEASDKDIIIILTLGLSPSFKNFIITLDATPPEQLTLDYVTTHLLNEES